MKTALLATPLVLTGWLVLGSAGGFHSADAPPALLMAEGPPSPATWSSTVVSLRGRIGQRVTFACPPGGAPGSVWGTDVYTDDSSVCTAAVHAGLISFADGGTVTVEIKPGQPSYVGTGRNGVVSGPYGSWVGSYVFVGR